MSIFKKNVSEGEYVLTKKASEHGIAPDIISYDNGSLKLEKYPMTLLDYIDNGGELTKNIKNNIYSKVRELHKLGIYHGDLHSNNIVIEPETEEIKIIDFERSMLFEDMYEDREEIIKKINSFLEIEFNTVEEIIDFDFYMYERDF